MISCEAQGGAESTISFDHSMNIAYFTDSQDDCSSIDYVVILYLVLGLVVILLFLFDCLFLLSLFSDDFVFSLCFVVLYLVSFLVFQSSRWERDIWLLYFNCILMSGDDC